MFFESMRRVTVERFAQRFASLYSCLYSFVVCYDKINLLNVGVGD
jgi:hypothetical protein